MVNYVQIIRVSTQNQTKLTKTDFKLADLDQTRHKQAKTWQKPCKTLIVNVEWTLILNLI